MPTIRGDDTDNTLVGTDGDDIIAGYGGDDDLSGGLGLDALLGGTGNDTLRGGDGVDELWGDAGDDILYGGEGHDWLYALERLNTSETDTGTVNRLYGEGGDDILVGAQGRDFLDGGDGNDSLSSSFDDTAHGGDQMDGGDGNDTLVVNGDVARGGVGDDQFRFSASDAGANDLTGGDGADTYFYALGVGNFLRPFTIIRDFNIGQGDRIDLGLSGHHRYPLVLRGALSNPDFSLTVGTRFSDTDYGPGFSQIWTWFNDGKTYMFVDQDGGGTLSAGDAVLTFEGAITLTADAFISRSFYAFNFGTGEIDTFSGTEAADEFFGLNGDDVISGNGGFDTLHGNNGDDQIDGGAGDDKLYGEAGDDVLRGGGGADLMYGGSGGDTLYGGDHNDNLHTTGSNAGDQDAAGVVNIAYGEAGNDSISGGASDELYGGDGDDSIFGGRYMDGGAGNDSLRSASNVASHLSGGDGADSLQGGFRDDHLEGGADNDFLDGYLGNDTLVGGAGDDTIVGDNLLGSAWSDPGNRDAIDGGDGADRLFGQAGDDLIHGGAGADLIEGGYGSDVLHGGEGNDQIFTNTYPSSFQYDVNAIDLAYGEDGDDTITGGDRGHLFGGNGNDTLRAGSADHRLDGGADNDLLIGSTGHDILLGGAGDDTVQGGRAFDRALFEGLRSDYVITTSDGVTTVTGLEGTDTLTGVELLVFNDQQMLISGGEVRQAVVGGQTVEGTVSGDLLTGLDGADTLLGYGGDDFLDGGAGNDVLVGGGGFNLLSGGDGYDIAAYEGARYSYAPNSQHVVRYGGTTQPSSLQSVGDRDTLSGIEALAFVDGQLSFHRDGMAAQVMRLYDSAFNRIPDGSGFEAQLDAMEGGLSLEALAQLFVDSAEFQNTYGALADRAFVEQLYRNVLDREGDEAGIANALNSLSTQGGSMTRGQLLVAFSESTEHMNLTQWILNGGLWIADEQTLIIARLYDAAWNRLPDEGGLVTWRNALGGGMSLEAIADAFAGAAEFTNTYGTLTDRQFVEQLYRNVLNREADEGGIANALSHLESQGGTMSRGDIMLAFSESSEHIALTRDLWIGGVSLYSPPRAPGEAKDAGEPQTLPGADDFVPLDAGNDDALVLPGVDDGLIWAKEADEALVLPGLDDGSVFVTPNHPGFSHGFNIALDDVFHGLRNEGWLT